MHTRSYYHHFETLYQNVYGAGLSGWWEVLGYGPSSLDKASKHLTTRARRYTFVPRRGAALELGCGDGIMAVALAKAGYRASGIDISETVIEQARRLASSLDARVEHMVGDVTDLEPVPSESIDLAMDMNCLHVLVEPEDRHSMLCAVRRVLAERGVLYIATMTTPIGPRYQAGLDDDERYEAGHLFDVTRSVGGREVRFQIPLLKRAIHPKQVIFRELLAAGLVPVRWQHRKKRTISDLYVWAVRDDNRQVRPGRRILVDRG